MHNPLDPGYYRSEDLRTFGFKAVGDNVRIAKNCTVIGPENIAIGDNVRIDANSVIIAASGQVKLGSYIHIGTHCLLGARGRITLDDFTGLSHGAKLISANDDFSGDWMISHGVPERFLNVHVAPIRLRSHSVVLVNAIVMPGVEVPEGTVVGAGAFVHGALQPWSIYAGIPTRRIGARSRRLLELEAELIGRVTA